MQTTSRRGLPSSYTPRGRVGERELGGPLVHNVRKTLMECDDINSDSFPGLRRRADVGSDQTGANSTRAEKALVPVRGSGHVDGSQSDQLWM